MCLIHSLQYETRLHVKLLLMSSSCKVVVIGVEQKWDERSGTAIIKTQARLQDPEKPPPIPKLKDFNNFNFFYTKNVSLKYVKYNLIILKWWLLPLSLASTLFVFFMKCFLRLFTVRHIYLKTLYLIGCIILWTLRKRWIWLVWHVYKQTIK